MSSKGEVWASVLLASFFFSLLHNLPRFHVQIAVLFRLYKDFTTTLCVACPLRDKLRCRETVLLFGGSAF